MRAFLDLPDGMAVRIGSGGILVGRHRSCDIQLADESASRRHALLRVAPEGVELVVLGRQPVHVDDQPCAAVQLVRDGARVAFPGFSCRVRVEPIENTVRVDYALRRGNQRFPIRTSPFAIGAGGQVDLAGWPADAIRFQLAQGVLFVELGAAGTLNGADLPSSAMTQLAVGDVLGYRDHTFTIEHASDGSASTVVTPRASRPTAIVLQPLARGGRITFTFDDGDRTVYLPGRRFQLVSALVMPPRPHAAGEYVPDSELVPLVWDDTDEVGSRKDLNVVLTRCRQDLVAAGIAATALLERAPGGRATRVVLAPGATIEVAEVDVKST